WQAARSWAPRTHQHQPIPNGRHPFAIILEYWRLRSRTSRMTVRGCDTRVSTRGRNSKSRNGGQTWRRRWRRAPCVGGIRPAGRWSPPGIRHRPHLVFAIVDGWEICRRPLLMRVCLTSSPHRCSHFVLVTADHSLKEASLPQGCYERNRGCKS
ncbi:hypothetical protein GQ607_007396, partial [Colletotrichum asianum]